MVSGHPDYQTQAGRALGGRGSTTLSFAGAIASGATANLDVPAIPTDRDRTIQGVGISVPEDAFIHTIKMFPISTSTIFFQAEFVRDGFWSFTGDTFGATTIIRIQITNNGDSTLVFTGEIFYVDRDL